MTGPDLPDDRKVEQPQERSFFSRPPRPLERHEPLALPDDVFEEEEEDETRSIFSTTWFRVVVVVVVLAVVAAVAGPYVLDTVSPPLIGGRASLESAATGDRQASTTPAAGTVTPAVTQSTDQAPIPAATSGAAPPATGATAAGTPAPQTTPATLVESAKPAPGKDESAAKPATASETATPQLAQPAPAPVKPAAAPKVVARATETKASASRPVSANGARATAAGGDFWVQVGAFKNGETAKRIAARLRQQQYPVQESVIGGQQAAPPAVSETVDRYLVVVEGATAAQVTAKLANPALKAETSGTGVIVRPGLALREAVELSRALETDGLRVQVRRTSRDAGRAASGDTLHRVRVGGFHDRDAAVAASRQLAQKGYQTYVARGNE